MQNDYPMIAKIEVELTQEKEMDQLPNRPSKIFHVKLRIIAISMFYYLSVNIFIYFLSFSMPT